MKSVADELHRRTSRELDRMSAAERVRLALRLGERDLELFCNAQSLSREEAKRQIRAQRQKGRTPSAAARS